MVKNWKHFTAISSAEAQCNYCPSRYNTKNTTSSLKDHMKVKHKDKDDSDRQSENLDSDDSSSR